MKNRWNKKGWIEIVEAVVAILLVATVLIITLNKSSLGKSDLSEEVYKTELSILREIENNNELRTEILEIEQFPVEWDNFPEDLKEKIISRTPSYLVCQGRICKLCEEETCSSDESGLPCNLEEKIENDVFSQSVVISGTIEGGTVGYRRLKLFCWTK